MENALDRLSLWSALGFSFLCITVTYSIFLILFNNLIKRNTSILIGAISCFLIENLLWLLFSGLLTGLDLRSIFSNLMSVGLCSLMLPHVHQFFNGQLKIPSYSES
jgi:hypothetical protein